MVSPGLRSFEWTLATKVQAGQEVVVLVESAVLVDVDLDARQVAERRQVVIDAGNHIELLQKSIARQASGDREAWAVVCQHRPLMAQVDAGLGHLPRRTATVAPVAVRMAVSAKRGQQRSRVSVELVGRCRQRRQVGQVLRHLAGSGFHDHGGCLGADVRQIGERAGCDAASDLVGASCLQRCGCLPERADAIGLCIPALEHEGDATQRRHGIFAVTGHGRSQHAEGVAVKRFHVPLGLRAHGKPKR